MITFDATANGPVVTDTSLTFSHTCTGNNRILFVGVDTGSNADTVTGVTYNGVATTRINTINTGGVSNNRRGYLYYLLNPATGAHNVVISTNTSIAIRGVSASYTGALQSGVPDASNTNNGNVTTITTTTTTVANSCFVVSVETNDSDTTPAAGTGLTLRGSTSVLAIGDNGAPKTSAGAVSLTWDFSPISDVAVCQASFAPVPDLGGGALFAL